MTRGLSYRLTVCARDDVPAFGPNVPDNFLFDADAFFGDFLRTKLINAERAALQAIIVDNFICCLSAKRFVATRTDRRRSFETMSIARDEACCAIWRNTCKM